MRSLLTIGVAVVASAAIGATGSAAQPCEGQGWKLRACLRAHFKPQAPLDYDRARDALFADVWLRDDPDGGDPPFTVEGIYGGYTVPMRTDDPAETPRQRAQRLGLNTEHVYPQSRGAAAGNARADLHHLAPVHAALNSARSNFPFGAVPDDEAVLWCRAAGCTATQPPASDDGQPDGSWTRLYREGTEPPYANGRVEPRDAVKGDVARAAFYFAAVYQVEAEDALPWPEGRRWFLDQRDVLLDWHEADPPDAWETERTLRAAAYQEGKPNPFVLYPGLVRDAFFRGQQQQNGRRDVWINEFHVTNDGPDTAEGVELAGRAGTDLYAWRLVFYGGHDGEPYNPADPLVGERVTFDTRIPHEAGRGDAALGAVWQPVRGLWNRCHGLALFDPDLELVQFLSYGGCTFNATAGPVYAVALAVGAADPAHPDSLVWSDPILGPERQPVQEWSRLPPGYSLQLSGAGSAYDDLAWAGPLPASPGRLNDYQAPANRRAPAPPAPLTLTASIEAADPRPHIPPPPLTLSAPFPNPAGPGQRIRFSLSNAGPSVRLRAVAYDALGREVALLHDGPAPASVELAVDPSALRGAPLAPGVYLLRVTATRPGGRTDVATRPFTVLR